MTSEERVLRAFRFQAPDPIPVYDKFWEYPKLWKESLGPAERLTDIARIVPEEGALYTRARRLKQKGDCLYGVDVWGRTVRRREGAYFYETLTVPFAEAADVDKVTFDSPHDEARYCAAGSKTEFKAHVQELRRSHYVYVKTGGPYLRSTFMRGEAAFLMDMAADPELARRIAEKVGDHITAVGVEALERAGLRENGVWIYDDMAGNSGPMFSPQAFERVLLPAYRRMIATYRRAGAKFVLLHSNGDVRLILDMLIDAGIDGLNPLERRAGMDIVRVRERYPRLILTVGMCNTDILVKGSISRIEAEARKIIDLGRNGGEFGTTFGGGQDNEVVIGHRILRRSQA